MQIEIDSATILSWAGSIIAGLAILAMRGIGNKIDLAFKRLDKVRHYLLKNTSYSEDDGDDK